MDKAKRDLWDRLAEIWGAETWLRTDLLSGRDVLRRQRSEGNYKLVVCLELTPGEYQYEMWIGVEATSDCAIAPGSSDIWSGLGDYDYVLSIRPSGAVEVGRTSLLSGMPTNLYPAWQQTNQLLNGRLNQLLERQAVGLSRKLSRVEATT